MIKVDISNIWGEASLPELLKIEKEIFDEKGNSKYPENSPEYKRYEKFDRLWSLMFYIGDMYGIA